MGRSNRPTRDERIARQELDRGDPDERVYFNRAQTSAIYHDRRDCTRLKQVPDERIDDDTRAAEQRRWHAPCLHCVLEDVEMPTLATDGGACGGTNAYGADDAA